MVVDGELCTFAPSLGGLGLAMPSLRVFGVAAPFFSFVLRGEGACCGYGSYTVFVFFRALDGLTSLCKENGEVLLNGFVFSAL